VGHPQRERAPPRSSKRLEPGPDPEHLACALLDPGVLTLCCAANTVRTDIDRALRLRKRNTAPRSVVRRAQEVAERSLIHLGRLGEARALDEAEHRRLVDTGQFGMLPPLAAGAFRQRSAGRGWAAAGAMRGMRGHRRAGRAVEWAQRARRWPWLRVAGVGGRPRCRAGDRSGQAYAQEAAATVGTAPFSVSIFGFC
jgi:hypothetical protein